MSIYLKYGNISGNVSDKGFNGLIKLIRADFGVGRKITSETSTQKDRESSNAKIRDLHIVKSVDKSTPYLFVESCCGRGVDAEIIMSKTGAGGGSEEFMRYSLKNALISDYLFYATEQDEAKPLERLTLSFVDMDMKYTPFDENGVLESPIAVGFNTATNMKK